MPTDKQPILVSGGVVETRDPTLFGAGDLARAQDAYYKPNDPAVWSVFGREEFNSSDVGASVLGLRYLEYDGEPDVILLHTGTKIMEAPAALTGTFTDAVTGLASSAMKSFDVCHYNNQQVLMDGISRNRVREKNGTYRFQGMLENTEAPVYFNVGSGTGFVLALNATLTYWVEEQVRDGFGVIKRRNASPGTAMTVTVTGNGTTVKPRIFRPDIVNDDATHWALYVSALNGVFPIGVAIASAPIATLFLDDPRANGVTPALKSNHDLHGAALILINNLNRQALAAAQFAPIIAGLPEGELYQTVIVSIDNIMRIFPKNGPPPISSTADIMEDSMVMTDMTDRSKVWFNFPDDIDSVPYTNFIRFETKGADVVQWARFLGRGTIVALRDSLWRIDSLPQPTDASFQISRVKVQIAGAHGGIGALTVVPFSFGQADLLAYASRAGILVTDGETWSVLTSDVDWSRVDISKLDQSHMINNPLEFRLEFTYTPRGGAVNSETMFLHYHPSHVKTSPIGTSLVKVTRPVRRGGMCKTVATIDNTPIVFSGQTNGKVYQEWVGFSDPLGDIEFDILTGDKFPYGVGKQARGSKFYVHHQAGGVAQRATAYAIQRTEGLDDEEEKREFPLKRREHTSIHADLQAEAFQFGVRATNPTSQIGIDYFVPAFEDYGDATAEGEA